MINEIQPATRSGLLRQCLLQWVFPLAVTWLLFLVLVFETKGLSGLNPFAEGRVLHQLFEDGMLPLTAAGILTVALLLQHRLLRSWPAFLQLPESAPLYATVLRLLAHGAGLFLVIIAGTVLIFYGFYDPAKDPQGQFHIWVWGGGFLYALGLTPTAALFTVWWAVWRW
ncbi:MAG: hypothetical protein A2277_15970 [Desulfobacterales bacterium RIFOXYA12_FULL_46_15]|nr:MAG: hypothetical protein A2097_13320 [Desulfobacula sp. GWF2_41_7]OGR26471.1 MAG: hypothetical protein A2277_15970 [Desulfobacterales bacterium RIFOXYA12_FULL_46_15]